MPETTPTTPTTATTQTPPPADAAKAKATRGDVNQSILADIKLAEDVAAAAQDAGHAAKLAEEDLPATAATDLLALAKAARDLVGRVVTAKNDKLAATQAEAEALDTLMTALRDLQQRAKRKFDKGDPKLAAYCIGKTNFGRDRETLEQDAENIIKLATADALPGLKPDKLAAAGRRPDRVEESRQSPRQSRRGPRQGARRIRDEGRRRERQAPRHPTGRRHRLAAHGQSKHARPPRFQAAREPTHREMMRKPRLIGAQESILRASEPTDRETTRKSELNRR